VSRRERQKGKRGEQSVAALLRPIFGDEVRTKRAGGESACVDRGRDLLGTPGLCVQVKEMARPRPLAALDEACAMMAANEIPVAFVKESWTGIKTTEKSARGRWCVVLRAEDFVGLFQLARLNTAVFGATFAEDQPPPK
jgi:hypothetical protein